MKPPGGAEDLLVRSRSALLDALGALKGHRDSVVVIGAQAIYLRTFAAPVALAEFTKDSDLAIDTRNLEDDPLIEAAMSAGGFTLNPVSRQPGAWVNDGGIPVDLMVPERIAGAGGKNTRGARIPPHSAKATRRARGLEAAVVDNSAMTITSLEAADPRTFTVRVAGPAALLVAKMHKLGERREHPTRLNDKDAHDCYRILINSETAPLADRLQTLAVDPLCGEVTSEALDYLGELFASGSVALGSMMAGRAEEGIGDPERTSLQTSILAADLLEAIRPYK